jgi:predicted nuclease of predicted toxin-antitoxin system
VKLLVDMNLSPTWVGHLAAAGHEAEHWSTVGAADASDATLMAYARERGLVVLTHDLDFGAILAATGGLKPSVVQIRGEQLSPTVIGVRVVAALRQLETELAAGALVTVDPGRTRISVLPLPGVR